LQKWLDDGLLKSASHRIGRIMEHVLSLTAIRDQKSALNRVILDAQAQIADLEVAERIVRRFGQATGDARPSDQEIEDLLGGLANPVNTPLPRLRINSGTLTSRALIMAVLRQSLSIWMTANEIQERASAIKGQEVPMATISPTLSNMKKEGLIERDGFKVALTERLTETGPQSGSPPRDPEPALVAQ
jgi:hypothetical protein